MSDGPSVGSRDGSLLTATHPVRSAATSETAGVVANDEPVVAGKASVVPRRWIALAALVVAAGRLAYSLNRVSLSLGPDEFATVGMARFMAGGHFNMLATHTYRPGLSILLTPIFAVVDDPEWLVRLSLGVNAVVAAATLFWFVPVVQRLTNFDQRGVLVSSVALALLPASLEASAHLWAEPLVTLSFVATLHAVLKFYDAPAVGWGLSAVLWPVVGFTSHGRLLPLIGLAAAAVIGRLLIDRRVALALSLGAAAAIATLLSSRLQDYLVSQVWQFPGDQNTSSTIIERLRSPLQVLDSAIGQVWYQLCASALLFGLGAVELGRRVNRRRGPLARRDALIVLGLTLPMMVVSMVFMSDRVRADHVIYGRYNDAIMWPVLAIGAGWLFHDRFSDRSRRVQFIIATVVGGTIALGLLLWQLHYVQFRVKGVEPMIAGLVPVMGGGAVDVARATLVGVAVFAVLFGVSAVGVRRSTAIVLVVAMLLLTAGGRLWTISRPFANAFESTSVVREVLDVPEAPEPGTTIGVSVMPDEYGPDLSATTQVLTALGYQWYLPEYEFTFDNGPSDDVGPYVFAVTNDALLSREGGTIVWTDPEGGIALWLEP